MQKTNYKHQRQHLLSLDRKGFFLLVGLLMFSNVFTYLFFNVPSRDPTAQKTINSLYLLDKASSYVYNIPDFERKVRKVSRKLKIHPEWLMAVMHSESRFDAAVANHKGSGATGLIQFMPKTAKNLNTTTSQLKNMSHVDQLDYVYKYLNEKRKTYKDFENLTELYLAILYPKAIPEDYCYTLYAQPSKAYKMNVGLDKDKDGRVTVRDIDKHLKKRYPKAYILDASEDQSVYARMTQFIGGI